MPSPLVVARTETVVVYASIRSYGRQYWDVENASFAVASPSSNRNGFEEKSNTAAATVSSPSLKAMRTSRCLNLPSQDDENSTVAISVEPL